MVVVSDAVHRTCFLMRFTIVLYAGHINESRVGKGRFKRGREEETGGGGEQSSIENGNEVHEIRYLRFAVLDWTANP